jgi:hypothetical protein
MSTEAQVPAAATAPSIKSATAGLDDFSDRLPPMLVKELRQGLRARTFVAVFLGLQLFLGLVMLLATTASGLDGAGLVVSRIIFLFFSLAVLVVQPLRGMNALYGEIKSSTIDMMVLTRLSARRIVTGKWAAVVGQTLLLFISIVPYLILRYFFGGMNLFAEMLALFSLFVLSTCLTAFNVGFSANKAILVRGFFPIGVAVLMANVCMGIGFSGFGEFLEFFLFSNAKMTAIYLGTMIGLVYLAWTAMGLGVSAIAPAAENHSTLSRLITLGVMALVGAVLYFADADWMIVPFAIGAVAVPGIVLGLTEENFLMPRITLPFIKFGHFGKAAGRFLYPCWSAGVFFAAALIVLVFGLALLAVDSKSFSGRDEEFLGVIGSLLGCLMFPAVFLALFQKSISNRLGIYVAILVGMFAVMGAVYAVSESTHTEGAMWVFCWLPPVQLVMSMDYSYRNDFLLVIFVFDALYLLFLIIHAVTKIGVVHDAENSARDTYLMPQEKVTVE